jgi:hypothetical protein
LIIRNDTILYEKYNGKYADFLSIFVFYGQTNDINTIGIAIEEGKIKSIDNPITDYLTEFKNKPGFEKITKKTYFTYFRNKIFRSRI